MLGLIHEKQLWVVRTSYLDPSLLEDKKNWRAVPLNERFVTVLWLKDGD